MSHVHCPACRYAFNLATSAACPRCAPATATATATATADPWPTPPPTRLDALAEVDVALDRLAAALGRLADDELDAVAMKLAATQHPDTWAGVIAGAIAAAALARRSATGSPVIRFELEPPVPAAAPVEDEPLTPRERALATMVLALLARLAARLRRW
jgi:hypothetical protein